MRAIEWESVCCSLCGANRAEPFISASDHNYGVAGEFQLVRCARCGLVYQNPRPMERSLLDCYPEGYDPHLFTKDPLVPRTRWELLKERIKRGLADDYFYPRRGSANLLRRTLLFPFYVYTDMLNLLPMPSLYARPQRVLDIGCGTGNFLRQLAQEGWEVHGIEPGAQAAATAQTALGSAILNEPFRPGLYPEGFFDLITLGHVLEHLSDPFASLCEARRLLKLGGNLIVGVPNIASLEFRLMRSDWLPLDLPRHLYHFSPQTLRRMLEHAGFHIRRIGFDITPLTLEASLENRAGRCWTMHGTLSPRVLRSRFWPLAFIFARLRTSSTMTFCAVKVAHV